MANDPITEIANECLALRVRMLSRVVSSLYDHALSPHGLTIAQVNMLVFVGRAGPCAPSTIGRMMQLERSTVSRNLDRMVAQNWLAVTTDDGGRVREVRLTAAGRHKIASFIDAWRSAQKETASMLGAGGVASVRALGSRLWSESGVPTRL